MRDTRAKVAAADIQAIVASVREAIAVLDKQVEKQGQAATRYEVSSGGPTRRDSFYASFSQGISTGDTTSCRNSRFRSKMNPTRIIESA